MGAPRESGALMALKLGSLFSGAGGLDLGVTSIFDAETVWVCEFNKDAQKVLAARFPGLPNLIDVTTVDWATVEGVDILCGGFPCQDVSCAGVRKGLTDGTRSGLWSYFAEAISALRPKFVVIENVRGLLSATANRNMEPNDSDLGEDAGQSALNAAGAVLGDLAGLGYNASWRTVSASWWGAPHQRERVFILAYRSDLTAAEVEEAIRPESGVHPGLIVESGDLLPTPTAGYYTRGSKHLMLPYVAQYATGHDPVPDRPDLKGRPDPLLPTPIALQNNTHNSAGKPLLTGLVKELFPTPRASDGNGGRCQHGTGGPDLRTAVDDAFALMPTPMATDGDRKGYHPDRRRSFGIGASIVQMVDLAVAYNEPEWHQYDPAVKRWETLFRPAPYPVVPGNGSPQLNPRFSEWMMGWPLDWVNIEGLSRRAQLRICGNGVVPQQAAGALRWMLADLLAELNAAVAA
ncbi:DNA cytosine methyltransferase [Mycobacteroides abscessus]|uniref:DNA cytosine methyltransferase n=1 Tax=Mycobacteroides abscessus TaxID=36809 RepID=UPI00092959A8|nr:DNA (cytosine-5-)-methyltransferase [Mycobacteroides abscessus]SHZ90866.1 phage DNA methylase [Mycobacteroides abscessus subsp. abscessus]SIA08973.1 phage DNA methylase [Mycobacteroides abscessus subsp. abscessus]SIA66589.1 phage DNA methylase [Mycobacteroides abscessus subsp. abscessus]SIA71828.1 phage DNA methylase [Mycobacteroides abscessus subsp. abscessus]SIA72413.1 phage DNA methylase [Mycobacteroides abscessus subsp. abscessus]